jgi:uncharacterized circularly permuted ATP-grasp superfamily protein
MYRRFDEDYVDTDLPEMHEVYLAGGISFVNAVGSGIADDKAVFPYVPTMIERYLDETTILQNAPTPTRWSKKRPAATYWPGSPS